MKTPGAQIYKSDLRFKSEDESFRRFSVFNFEYHFDESRQPFGNLLAVNEETLGPQHKIFRHVETDMDIVIIPLTGAILYSDSIGSEDFIATEHIRVFKANAGMSYTIENPYPEDLIQYLQIWIAADASEGQSEQQKFEFPGKNILFPIFSGESQNNILKLRSQSRGFLGIFDGRATGEYNLKGINNGLFVFVINGTFDFQNRLLEKGDALSLAGVQHIAFEAISENALLVLIETIMAQ